jgi:hypothetical protein
LNRVIEIIVSPTGEAKIETRGFSGSSCCDASRFLEDALGARVTEKLTAEFYQERSAHQTLREGTS